jgi:hypothetical protein
MKIHTGVWVCTKPSLNLLESENGYVKGEKLGNEDNSINWTEIFARLHITGRRKRMPRYDAGRMVVLIGTMSISSR